jgi:hypothetical protein
MTDIVSIHLDSIQTLSNSLQEALAIAGEQLEECRELDLIDNVHEAFGVALTGAELVSSFQQSYNCVTREIRAGAVVPMRGRF